jgi:hypothetical protein
MLETERTSQPIPTVILERNGVRLGFAVNGGDASQDGAAIQVSGIAELKAELDANGVEAGNWRVDDRTRKKFQVVFATAPDGLCYYFFEPL